MNHHIFPILYFLFRSNRRQWAFKLWFIGKTASLEKTQFHKATDEVSDDSVFQPQL